jgi:hypothetical protein
MEQVGQIGRVVRRGESDDDGRMGLAEASDDSGHGVGSQDRQAADVQGALLETDHGRQRRFARVQVTKRLPGRLHQGGAGGCEGDISPQTVEQLGAQLRLQLLHRQRQCRLGDVDGVRRPGEPAVFRHRQEHAEAAHIHLESIWRQQDFGLGLLVGAAGT